MRKIIFWLFLLGFIFFCFNFALAQEKDSVEIDFFFRPGCFYCAREKDFLAGLQKQYPQVKINMRPVSEEYNIELLERLYQKYEVPKEERGLVPITFSRERYFLGFDEEVAKQIEACIEACLAGKGKTGRIQDIVSLPLLGKIDPAAYSLPALAVILGFFDGFNVCSLGALVLILGLVVVLRSRKQILIFGGLFILTTAVVYGFLIFLWYQLFAILTPYLRALEILIGLLGVGGAVYFLREFIRFRKQGPVCEPGKSSGIISKFSSKVQNALEGKKSILAITLSILFFAAVITIVEFPCSAAVPVFFAGLLAKAQISVFYYLFCLAIFLFFYILDEFVVFLVAVFTMSIKLASVKFTTYITLIESIVLFVLGFYYLFGFLIF